MTAVLFRIAILAIGLGLVETGLADAFGRGSAAGWVLLVVGLPLVFAGTAGSMTVLLGGRSDGVSR